MNFMNKFECKIHKFVMDNNMLSVNDNVVIGVSGGADSICLLKVLINMSSEYNLKLHIVHVHHGIRGSEADRDQKFVKQFCEKYPNITYYLYEYDIPALAKEYKMSEEEVGRMMRYKAFNDVKTKVKADKIAVAHNLNDNVETVLFNLCRGTGISGLKGIINKNNELIRPLLCVTREEIESYLSDCEQVYIQDSTNFEEDYTRNKIRLNVIPYLEKNINFNVKEHINNLSKIALDTENFMSSYTDKVYERIVKYTNEDIEQYMIDIELFNKEEYIIRQRIIRKCILTLVGRLKDISNVHIDDIAKLSDKNVGKYIVLPYGIVCKRGYRTLNMYIARENITEEEILYEEIKLNQEYFLPYYNKHIIFECIQYEKSMDIPRNDYTKWFDYGKMNDIVVLRNRKSGDKIQLNPEGTTKKLKDLMIDLKINKEERNSIPLVAHGQEVLWLIGKRNSEAYRVDEHTREILQIRMY